MLYGWCFLAYHVLVLVLVSVVSYFSDVMYGWYSFVVFLSVGERGVAAGCLCGLSCLVIVFTGCFFMLFFCSSIVVGCLLIVGRFDE